VRISSNSRKAKKKQILGPSSNYIKTLYNPKINKTSKRSKAKDSLNRSMNEQKRSQQMVGECEGTATEGADSLQDKMISNLHLRMMSNPKSELKTDLK
jgi:hypothetical protein